MTRFEYTSVTLRRENLTNKNAERGKMCRVDQRTGACLFPTDIRTRIPWLHKHHTLASGRRTAATRRVISVKRSSWGAHGCAERGTFSLFCLQFMHAVVT